MLGNSLFVHQCYVLPKLNRHIRIINNTFDIHTIFQNRSNINSNTTDRTTELLNVAGSNRGLLPTWMCINTGCTYMWRVG